MFFSDKNKSRSFPSLPIASIEGEKKVEEKKEPERHKVHDPVERVSSGENHDEHEGLTKRKSRRIRPSGEPTSPSIFSKHPQNDSDSHNELNDSTDPPLLDDIARSSRRIMKPHEVLYAAFNRPPP